MFEIEKTRILSVMWFGSTGNSSKITINLEAYEESEPSFSTMSKWTTKFQCGLNVEDDPRCGHLKALLNSMSAAFVHCSNAIIAAVRNFR